MGSSSSTSRGQKNRAKKKEKSKIEDTESSSEENTVRNKPYSANHNKYSVLSSVEIF